MGISRVVARPAARALLLLGLVACHAEDPCGATSPQCKGEGRCTPQPGRCVARSDEACAASDLCAEEGRCSAREDRCTVISRDQCEKSRACSQEGRCTPDDGFCSVKSMADCAHLARCGRGSCKLEDGRCKDRPYNPDNQEGGCPCGCDHSEKMASELKKSPASVAEGAIQRALIAIAEREDAGYITWAMVTHRRRLLATSQDLLGITPGGRGVPLPSKPAIPPSSPRLEGDGLMVRAELMVHGETTEPVDGEDKGIRASFRLGLEISNTSSKTRTVAPPRVLGDAGFPVSTWYMLGSDGGPWDGKLEPKQTRQVNAIGYLDEPLAPGALAIAEVQLEGLRFEVKDVARAHWR